MTEARFPDDFVFGTATASYQIEGAVREDGRGESIWDRFSHTPGKTHNGDTGDVACDHYHRVDQDIALMKALNTTAYRFSIAWPRIIPDGDGPVNPKGLDFYSRLVDKLLAAGITPFATMFHWDLPQALEDRYGGWRSRKTVDAFARYADTVAARLGDRIKNWMTLNEIPCIVFLGHKTGRHAPGAQEPDKVINRIQHHCLLCHGHGVRAVRRHAAPDARVGLVHNASVKVPAIETPDGINAASRAFADANGPILDPVIRGQYPAAWLKSIGADAPEVRPGDLELIGAPTDFLGFNVYGAQHVLPADNDKGYRLLDFPPSYPHAFADWIKLVPQSVYWGLRFLHRDYGVANLYVSENGCAMDDRLLDGEVLDIDRVQYYRTYLAAAQRAVADGIPLKGYFAWTLMDNFEWAEGYRHRFGLHYTDYNTQQRIPKLSARFYAECARTHSIA